MSEIKVRLLADAQDLLREAKDASDKVESLSPVIRVEADTKAFTDGIKRAVAEAARLSAVIQANGRNPVPQPMPLAGGAAGAGGARNGGTNDPNRQLLDVLRNTQSLNNKAFSELKKVIEDLSKTIEDSSRRTRGGGSGGGGQGGGGGGDNDNSGLSWKSMLLEYMNIRPTGEDGGVRIQDLLGSLTGGQGGGLMSLLNAIPGMGMLTGILSGVGAAKMVAQAVTKDADINEGYREKATRILADTYDVFGSVQAYNPEEYGEEGYSQGAYITMRTAQQYGYDMDTALSASEAMMDKAGFTDTDSFNQDLDSVLAASRATGVDAASMAALAGKATQLGYQENGDQGKITNLLTREIEVSGMQGREDEVVDVLESILDELGAVNSTVSEQAVGDKLNLINALSANSGMSGERAKSAIDSIEDFTSSDDMSVMLAAGWGSGEFKGKEGWLKLREMQEEDPTAFMERVIKGFAAHGMSAVDINYALDRKGVGSALQRKEVINAVLNGSPVSADMNDSYANAVQGQAYTDRNNAQYDATIGDYVRWPLTEEMGDFLQGTQELPKYKDTWHEKNSASGSDMASDKWWRDRNPAGQWGNDLGTYDMSQGQTQIADMDAAWEDAKSGRSSSGAQAAAAAAASGAAASLGQGSSGSVRDRSSGYEAVPSQPPRISAALGEPAERDGSTISYRQNTAASYGPSENALRPIESLEDYTDMSVMITAGWGTEYAGKEGWLALRKMQQEDPAGYAKRVASGLAAKGMSDADIAYFLDRKGINTYADSQASEPAAAEPVLANPFSGDFWGNVQQNVSYMRNRLTGQAQSPMETPGGQQMFAAASMALNPLAGIAAAAAMAANAASGDEQRMAEPEMLTLTDENFGMHPVYTNLFDKDFERNQANNRAYLWNRMTGKADPWQMPQKAAPEEPLVLTDENFGMQPVDAVPFTEDFGRNVQNNWAYFWNSLTGKADPWQWRRKAAPSGSVDGQSGGQIPLDGLYSDQNVLDVQSAAVTDPEGDLVDALARNTDELKKNTQALMGGGSGDGSYVTGSQQQAALTNSGMVDSLSNSVSIQSPMSRFQQEHPFLYNLASGVRTAVTGAGNFFGGIGQAISDGLEALTGGGDSEPETFSSADGQSTVTLPDGTTTTKKADGTTITTGNGSISMTGSVTDEEDEADGTAIHRTRTSLNGNSDTATPHATGNDYVPYDGYKASLHRGEMVLPKHKAELFRQGKLDEIQLSIGDEEGDSPALNLQAFGSAWRQANIPGAIAGAGLMAQHNPLSGLPAPTRPSEEQSAYLRRFIETTAFKPRSPVTPGGAEYGMFNALKAEDLDISELAKAASAENADGKPQPKAASQTFFGALSGRDSQGIAAAASDDASEPQQGNAGNELGIRKLLNGSSAWAESFVQDSVGKFLEPSAPESPAAFGASDINVNINVSVTGTVEGMDPSMQRQMVDSIQAQIAGSGLRDMLANGITRRQNW